MYRKRLLSMVGASAVVAWCLLTAERPIQAQSGRGEHWVGTWATAVVARPQGPAGGAPGFGAGVTPQCFGQAPAQTVAAPAPGSQPAPAGPGGGGRGGRGGPPPAPINFNNQTLRQIVHTTLGGDRIRIVLSNAFGTSPLAVGAAHVALREKDAAIVAMSDRVLAFGGSPTVNIPPGSTVFSDPVGLTVPAFADLAIDLYLPGDTAASTSPLTTHGGALQTSYVSAPGDHTGAADLPEATTTAAWFFLARVEVGAPERAGAVVTFGDSITDGTRSTPNTNNRWPDQLAKRLQAQKINLAVLNQGIAGNRVLGDGAGVSAFARFDRDVLAQAGVTHVIVLESINDIGIARDSPCPTVRDLIVGQT